jgi:hypothetical protein
VPGSDCLLSSRDGRRSPCQSIYSRCSRRVSIKQSARKRGDPLASATDEATGFQPEGLGERPRCSSSGALSTRIPNCGASGQMTDSKSANCERVNGGDRLWQQPFACQEERRSTPGEDDHWYLAPGRRSISGDSRSRPAAWSPTVALPAGSCGHRAASPRLAIELMRNSTDQ